MSIVDVLLNKIDPCDIISSYGVELRSENNGFKGKCPIHQSEGDNVLWVTPENNMIYCFSCGWTGNVIQFFAEMENLGFYGAVEQLAEKYNIQVSSDPSYHKQKDQIKINASTQKKLVKNRDTIIEHLIQKRGLSIQTIDEFGIGYDAIGDVPLYGTNAEEKNFVFKGITFAVLDSYQRLVAFAKRRIDDGKPKYINSWDWDLYKKSELLYNIHRARKMVKKTGRLVVCEGYYDTASAWEQGEAVVGYCFGHLSKQQILSIKEILQYLPTHEILLAVDNDPTGTDEINKARLKFQKYFPNANIQIPNYPNGFKDINDLHVAKIKIGDLPKKHIDVFVLELLLKKCQTPEEEYNAAREYIGTVKSELIKSDIAIMLAKKWNKDVEVIKKEFSVRTDNKLEKLKNIHTIASSFQDWQELLKSEGSGYGWKAVDSTIDGCRRKEIALLCGYSTSGKSTVSAKIGNHRVIREKNNLAVFSGEMPRGQFLESMACDILGKSPYLLKDMLRTDGGCVIYEKVMEALEKHVRIIDKSGLNVKDMWEYVQLINTYEFEKPVDFVIFDHFHLIPGVNDNAVCADNANLMKDFVKEFNCNLLMLGQFNEASQQLAKIGKFREPTMSDVKGGNDLKAIADTILLIWRPYYTNLELSPIDRDEIKYITKLKVAKNRRGIKEGIYFDLKYDIDTTKMEVIG